MLLTDTGPLVALISSDERELMLTTWPCFAEAMSLLAQWKGHFAQQQLWAMLNNQALSLYSSDAAEVARMQTLMERYRDTPMDLADASLITAAETRGATRVFTLDSDFYVYRLTNGAALQMVP